MAVAQMLVEWLDKKSEEWIDSQEGLGEIYAEAQVEAAQQGVEPTFVGWPRCSQCGGLLAYHARRMPCSGSR